jgi:hypothetical protein
MPKPDKAPEILGILPLQDAVLFPNTVIPLAVVKRPGIQLVEEALRDISRRASLLRKEIQYGEFFKQIRLPAAVHDDGATAVYRDGILSIRLPLATPQKYPIVRTEIRMTVRRTPV